MAVGRTQLLVLAATRGTHSAPGCAASAPHIPVSASPVTVMSERQFSGKGLTWPLGRQALMTSEDSGCMAPLAFMSCAAPVSLLDLQQAGEGHVLLSRPDTTAWMDMSG